MSLRKKEMLRKWILSTAATSLLWNTLPTTASAQGPLFPKKKVATRPNSAKPNLQGQNAQGQIAAQANAGNQPTAPGAMNQGNAQTAAPIQQVSQNSAAAGEPSEVQRKLEELYEQNGREMPDMRMNLQPINQAQLQAQYMQQQSAQQQAPQQQANQQPQRQPQPQQNSLLGSRNRSPIQPATRFPQPSGQNQIVPQAGQQQGSQPKLRQASMFGYFKKFTNKTDKGLSNQPPIPPDMMPNGNVTFSNPQTSGVAAMPQAQQPAGVPPVRQAEISAIPAIPAVPAIPSPSNAPSGRASLSSLISSSGPSSPSARKADEMLLPPQPVSLVPALADEPVPIEGLVVAGAAAPAIDKQPNVKPATDTLELSDAPLALESGSKSKSRSASPISNSDSPRQAEFVNLHSDGVPAPRATANPVTEEPVSEQPVQATESEPIELTDETDSNSSETIESPFSVDGKDFIESGESAPLESTVDPTAPSLEIGAPAKELPSEDVSRKPAAASIDEPASLDKRDFVPPSTKRDAEKLQKIRERMGMKGLKGFCPVSLRDRRELVDAKPEFSFVFRSQKFHFASAEDRNAFAADPARYAPAAYGADVVALSRDKDVVEGTLDHAAWYKGRLYLFGSEDNYQAFIEDPIQFTTLDGVE